MIVAGATAVDEIEAAVPQRRYDTSGVIQAVGADGQAHTYDIPSLRFKRSPKQLILRMSNKKIKVGDGGNKSGKTSTPIVDIVQWHEGINRYRKKRPPIFGWIVVRDFQQGGEALIRREMEKWMTRVDGRILAKWNTTEHSWTWPDGGVCWLKSAASGVDSFAGPNLDYVVCDEEQEWEIMMECLARLGAAEEPQFWLMMTPLWGLTKVWKEWVEPCMKGQRKDICRVAMTLDDNPSLTDEQRKFFKSLYKGREADIRIRGLWMPLEQACPFDAETLRALYDAARPGMTFSVDTERGGDLGLLNYSLRQDEAGLLEVWDMPQGDQEYMLFGDAATGCGEDESVWQVWNSLTARQVAEWASNRVGLTEFSRVGTAIATLFNKARVVILRRHSEAVCSAMSEMYDNLYRGKDAKVGFLETAETKREMVGHGANLVVERRAHIRSRICIAQWMTLIRMETGKYEAAQGAKDDRCVTSLVALKFLGTPLGKDRGILQEREAIPGSIAADLEALNQGIVQHPLGYVTEGQW